ncbi:MAG: hypothetical protein HQL94_09555 [Magnetococcales bacterium]|nr:hypothetical protein [Magnetococcales bacterium]
MNNSTPSETAKESKRKSKPEKVESALSDDHLSTPLLSDAPSGGDKKKGKSDKNETESDDVDEAAAFLAEMAAVHPAPRNVVTDFQSIFRDLLPLTTLNRESTSWGDNKVVDKQKPDKSKKGKKRS